MTDNAGPHRECDNHAKAFSAHVTFHARSWTIDADWYHLLPPIMRERLNRWWDAQPHLPSRTYAWSLTLLDEGRVEVDVYILDDDGRVMVRDGDGVHMIAEYTVTVPPPREPFDLVARWEKGNADVESR